MNMINPVAIRSKTPKNVILIGSNCGLELESQEENLVMIGDDLVKPDPEAANVQVALGDFTHKKNLRVIIGKTLGGKEIKLGGLSKSKDEKETEAN